MMRDLNEKEKKIIELIQQTPKSFKELNEIGGNILRSESTLDRTLKSLKRMKYIESFPVNDPNTRIKKRYRLTEQYYYEKEALSKDQQLSKMIKSRLNWQNVFDKMRNFLEFEYPMFFENPDLIEAKEIYSDVFSYLVFFNIDSEMLRENSKRYFDLMLYLILHHPDEKYIAMQKEFDFNPIRFREIIDKFKNDNKLEEFIFQGKNKNKKEVYYVISEDPILYFIRQQVETYFFKFLLCWQFPRVYLEDHFDFLFHFSHQILDDLMIKFKGQKNQNVIKFLTNNRICVLTYIRKYILEFLDKIIMESNVKDIEYPLELLLKDQKEAYIFKLVSSPEILTGVEKQYLEYHIEFLCSNIEKIEVFKNLIEEVIDKIEEISNLESKKNEVLFLKSRLLMLLRIFYHQNKTSYKSFKKEYNSKHGLKKLSYSKISEEIFIDLERILPEVDTKKEDVKKKFIIRHLLERIDHLTNKVNKYPKEKLEFFQKIEEIYEIASKYFSEKSQYPFLKKKCELFLKDIDLFKDSEIIFIIKKLKTDYPSNKEILLLLFRYLKKTNNIIEVNNVIKNNHWILKDKILMFERFVTDISLEFNLIEFFNLKVEDLQGLLKSKSDESLKLINNLLKTIAYILESKGSIFDAYFIYYLTCILEQDIAFDPSKRGIIDSYFPSYDKNLAHFKAYAPAYLNVMRMYQQYSELLFSSTEFKEDITKLISHIIQRIDPPEKRDNYIKSFPLLIKNFLLIAEFFQLDSDFNEIMESVEKGLEFNINKTKKREIKTIRDISKEEKGILCKIRENFKDFNKNTESPDFLVAVFNIEKFLEDLNRTSVDKIIPQRSLFQGQFSKIANLQMQYVVAKFPELAEYSIRNYFSNNFRFYNEDLKGREFNINHFNFYNFQKNIMSEQKKSEFELKERIFTDGIDTNGYPFKLAFSRKYKIPELKDRSFWKDLFKDLENDENQLIELLDLYIFHSRFFVSFNYLEKFVLLILKKYDLENALNYLDTFFNYLIWFNERLKNPRKNITPYTLEQDSFFQVFDFCFNIIRAKIYWEYRERSKAQDHVNLADKSLKKVEQKSQKLFGLTIIIKYKKDLDELKAKLLI